MATIDETPQGTPEENLETEKINLKNSAEVKLVLYILPVAAVIALVGYLLSR